MADWSVMEHEWPNMIDPYHYGTNPYYQEKPPVQYVPSQAQSYIAPPSPAIALPNTSPEQVPSSEEPPVKYTQPQPASKGDTPREIRNRAEKQRRDKLNHSIAELASMVPPVVAASRKIDKTGVLRLTAHFLRSHNYVFGDSISNSLALSPAATQSLLSLFNGFLLTCTYRGLVVVASQNIQQYLGYAEMDLLGHSIFSIIHEEDRQMVREQLMPKPHLLGSNGELRLPNDPRGIQRVADELASDKRRFIVRFKKPTQRSEPSKYVTCHVEGCFRKADRASQGYNRCCQMLRRGRARSENPYSSGNDVVFIGIVRPVTDPFLAESGLESYRMEYRTRHSVDGQIIQTEPRMALITGYMAHEVNGVNAMNFMHRDDVRWVIIALREMYDQHRLAGESCYRLMLKNGQFVYMKTRGCLELDESTGAVTTFVCINTVVEEQEGKHLIKQMKRKIAMKLNNNEELPPEEEANEVADNQALKIEDPRQLKKVIMHLVTDLPAKGVTQAARNTTPEQETSAPLGLAIIPPKKENIVRAIDKIYTVIATLPKDKVDRLFDNQRKPLTRPNDNTKTTKPFNPTIHTPQASGSGILPKYQDVYPQYSQQTITTTNIVPRKPEETFASGSYAVYNSTTFEDLDIHSDSNNPVQEFLQPANTDYSFNRSHFKDDKNENDVQTENEVLQATVPSTGVKRSGNFQDQNVINKKKIADGAEENAVEETLEEEMTPNDYIFDNLLYDIPSSQLDNALNSLDQTVIDPNFTDFLNSLDGQDIITQIINETDDENLSTQTT